MTRKNISLVIFMASAVVGYSVIANAAVPNSAQEARDRANAAAANMKIDFPIAELGNCASKKECKTYCDMDAHMIECVAFAQKSGMISAEDAARAREFADVVRGEGPGGCTSKSTCEAYCDGLTHASECLAFAQKHNLLSSEDLKIAKKYADAVAGGAAAPGNCKNKQECESYCAVAEHASECLAFAEKAGMLSPEEIEDAMKVLPFLSRGETPGGCKSKEACKTYCDANGHFEECIGFAEKAGLVSAEEAATARKVGGVGPGNCKSKQSCDEYCNKKENAQSCFAFAKEKGILPADKLKEIEAGMGRLRGGLKQMPPEMVNCIKDAVGVDNMAEIEAGTLMPGPAMGEKIKTCVEQNMSKLKGIIQSAMKMADETTLNCLKGKVGEEGLAKIQSGDTITPEVGDVMKNCFENMRRTGLKKAQDGLAKMPAEMRQCVEQKLGAETVAKIQAGDEDALIPESKDAFESCVSQFSSKMKVEAESKMRQIPDSMRSCIESALGADFEEKVKNGDMDQSKITAAIANCAKNMQAPSGEGGNLPMMPSGLPGGMPSGIPSGMPVPASGGAMPPQGGPTATPEMCANFAAAPSCDYVPENARALCRQCKGQ